MAEGSVHKMFEAFLFYYSIISHQGDLELSDIVHPCQLEIESDTGSHHSAIDHDSNNKGER